MHSKGVNIDMDSFLARQETWRYKLWRWWSYTKIGSWWLEFKKGVKNLIQWRKVIYKQYPYDYNGLYEVIKFKLKVLGDGFENRKLVVGWEDSVKYIRICEKLCDRLSESYYEHEYFDYQDSEFEFKKLDDGSGNSEVITNTTRDELDRYFALYPKLHKKAMFDIINSGKWVKGAETSRSLVAGQMGTALHNKARKLLFKIIEEKLEGWWD